LNTDDKAHLWLTHHAQRTPLAAAAGTAAENTGFKRSSKQRELVNAAMSAAAAVFFGLGG
jgi:hypothetical protein